MDFTKTSVCRIQREPAPRQFCTKLPESCITVDFNSLWPRGFGNILGIWELRSRIRGFIVIGANQIANFQMKTTSLIPKLDSKFENFASKFEVYQDEVASRLLYEFFCTMAHNPFVTQGKTIPNQAKEDIVDRWNNLRV